jgi:hypothetical protein
MGCLKCLAYLFDCVHPHTTWPHRDRAGLAYVCCLDCGRELPYSLDRMKIVTKEEVLADQNREPCQPPMITAPEGGTPNAATGG